MYLLLEAHQERSSYFVSFNHRCIPDKKSLSNGAVNFEFFIVFARKGQISQKYKKQSQIFLPKSLAEVSFLEKY